MTRTSTLRSMRSTARSRRLFTELETAQRRVLEMQLGVPTTPAPRGTSMLSQMSGR